MKLSESPRHILLPEEEEKPNLWSAGEARHPRGELQIMLEDSDQTQQHSQLCSGTTFERR